MAVNKTTCVQHDTPTKIDSLDQIQKHRYNQKPPMLWVSTEAFGLWVMAGSVELCQRVPETISTDCTWYHDEYQWTHCLWYGCRCRIPSAGCEEGPISLCTPEEEEDCMGQWIQQFWCSGMVEADPALPHTDFPKKERERTWSLLGYLISLILWIYIGQVV